ncbi:MAG TPA: ABATE domain-containing protein [Herbaspirillum sp.]
MTANRPPAMFLADALGLDFLNSIATPVDTPVEWLSSGQDLLDWMASAKLLSPEILAELNASAGPGELDAVAGRARALREWFRDLVRENKGKPLSPQVLSRLEPLNRLLARDEEFGQIAVRQANSHSHESVLEWVPQRRWRSSDALLLPIAKAMAALLVTADFSYVKSCEGPACTLMFLDTTRRHTRRWCSMAVCGNRAKQVAHRTRVHREGSSENS